MATSNVQRLEQNRSIQMSSMNRLETELRSQEVAITTLGKYINSLAYDKTDLVLPNDVLRILSQINVLQRRKSDGVTKPKTTTPRKLKCTVSSPDFGDRVSRIFRRNNLQIFSENGDSETDDDSLFTKSLSNKSLSDTEGIASKLRANKPEDSTQSTPCSLKRNGSLGRILTQEDIESLKKIAEKQSDKTNVNNREMSSINIEISNVDENSNLMLDPSGSTYQSNGPKVASSEIFETPFSKGNSPLEEPDPKVEPPSNSNQNSLKTRKISTGYLRRSTSANNVPTKPTDLNGNPIIRNYSKHPLDSIENNFVLEGPSQLRGFTPFSIKQKLPYQNSSPEFPCLSPPPGSRKLQESLLNNNDVRVLNKKTDFANSEKLTSGASDLLFNRSDLLTR